MSTDENTQDDPHRELYEITRALRLHLEWHARAGAYAAPAGPTHPPAPVGATPQAEVAETRHVARTTIPGTGAGAPEDTRESLTMSARLAQLLHEDKGQEKRQVRHIEPPAERARGTPPSLAQIRDLLGDCTRCKLSQTRTNIVFGVGDPHASLMFIGEGPGHQEDLSGEPFVGPAGQLLDKMITAMGWSRSTVYIANVVKCRPPRNRDPEPDEVAACRPFLARQIAAVGPRILVALGRPATHLLLGTDQPLGRLRGRFHNHEGIPVMPTYHPGYLLRKPHDKRHAWSDLKQVITELQRMGITPPHAPRR